MISRYPHEIEVLMKKWEPYGEAIYKGELQDVPEEAIKAYEECKAWAWEQGQ